MQLVLKQNRPFARSSHMVQNHTCWDAGCTVGLSKQRQVKVDWYELLCFGSRSVQLASQHVWFCTKWLDCAKGLFYCIQTPKPHSSRAIMLSKAGKNRSDCPGQVNFALGQVKIINGSLVVPTNNLPQSWNTVRPSIFTDSQVNKVLANLG